MRMTGRWGGYDGPRMIVVVLGCAAILVMLFLANWMNSRCWAGAPSCDEQDTSQR